VRVAAPSQRDLCSSLLILRNHPLWPRKVVPDGTFPTPTARSSPPSANRPVEQFYNMTNVDDYHPRGGEGGGAPGGGGSPAAVLLLWQLAGSGGLGWLLWLDSYGSGCSALDMHPASHAVIGRPEWPAVYLNVNFDRRH
jgi:hypothetical protein